MEREAAWRIEEARAVAGFSNTSDLAARANLNAGHMNALASANALVSLSGNRRQAMWQAKASVPDKGLLRPAEITEDIVELESPSEAEDVVADYRYIGLTLGRHPLSFLRERLSRMRFIPSDVLAGFSNGQLARGVRHRNRAPAAWDSKWGCFHYARRRGRHRQRYLLAKPGGAVPTGGYGGSVTRRLRHLAVGE